MSMKDGSANGAGRAGQRKPHEREERKAVQGKQKTAEAGCLTEDRVEPEGTAGAWSIEARETGNGDSANGRKPERSLFEAILNVSNMFEAQERVIADRGTAGTDGMAAGELNGYFIKRYMELCEI
jgi:hypothetical protein